VLGIFRVALTGTLVCAGIQSSAEGVSCERLRDYLFNDDPGETVKEATAIIQSGTYLGMSRVI
jgi:hypothetical protein